MRHWHPLFVKLLRPLVEAYYEVQTTVPVGDAPREADVVLLRRTGSGPLPFQGLWKNLTTWNVLEFKGPTVSPRIRDLDLLLELGLGIDRRLNEDRARQRLRPLRPQEVSFWYLASRLGRRFMEESQHRLGHLEPQGSGAWRCFLLRRMIFLVSSAELPVDRDSIPLHIVGREPPATQLAVGRLLVEQPQLWQLYGPWLGLLHPESWEEVEVMARTAGRDLMKIDLEHILKFVDMDQAIDQVIQHYGEKKVIKKIGIDRILAHLTPAERRELKRRLQ